MRRPHTLAVSWCSARVFPFPPFGPCEAITWRPIRSGAPAERGILETRRRRAGQVRRGNLPHRRPLRLAFALYRRWTELQETTACPVCPIPMFRGCEAGDPGIGRPDSAVSHVSAAPPRPGVQRGQLLTFKREAPIA